MTISWLPLIQTLTTATLTFDLKDREPVLMIAAQLSDGLQPWRGHTDVESALRAVTEIIDIDDKAGRIDMSLDDLIEALIKSETQIRKRRLIPAEDIAAYQELARLHKRLQDLSGSTPASVRVPGPLQPTPAAILNPALQTSAGRQIILYVDDDKMVRSAITRYLKRFPFEGSKLFEEILTASDGLEGLELLKSRLDDITVVLVDYDMPEMNGGEFMTAAHQLRPELPIMLFTGNMEDPDNLIPAASRPYSAFFHKLGSLNELNEALIELIRRKSR